MVNKSELLTPQDRIAWAIQKAKSNGLPPERLASKVGLSRPGLLHWTKETTDINAVGVGLLVAFCQATGVNLEWVLNGRGHPTDTYTSSEDVAELARTLSELEQEEPTEFRVIARLVRSAGKSRHEPQ